MGEYFLLERYPTKICLAISSKVLATLMSSLAEVSNFMQIWFSLANSSTCSWLTLRLLSGGVRGLEVEVGAHQDEEGVGGRVLSCLPQPAREALEGLGPSQEEGDWVMLQTRRMAAELRQKDLTMDLKVSCPAVSQICSRTLQFSSMVMILDSNSAPRVTWYSGEKQSLTQRERRQLFPVPESPTIMILNSASPVDTRLLIINYLYNRTLMSNNLLLTGHSAEVLALAYNQNTTLLASAGVDRTIMLWSALGNQDNTAVLKAHTNAVTSLTWTYTDRLLSASADKSIVNWDVQMQRPIRKYKSHKCVVHDVATPKKTLEVFASVADDGYVKIWEPRSKQEVKSIQTKYPLTSLSFSLHGERIFAGGIDNEIKVINVGSGKVEQAIQGHQDTISSLQISFDGSYLMSNSFDETIRVWDVRPSMAAGKRLKKTLSGHSQGNEKALIRGGWSIDGLYICCGSTDKCVYIWDTTTKKIVQRLGGHYGTVNQAGMGRDNWLASCSNDKTVIVSQLPEILL